MLSWKTRAAVKLIINEVNEKLISEKLDIVLKLLLGKSP